MNQYLRAKSEYLIATVYKSTGSWYRVKTENGDWFDARIKGKFKIKGIKFTNPLSVGDQVSILEDGDNTVIDDILPRNNYIVRTSPHARKQQIVAANVDQAILLASLKDPKIPTGFIDRFAVSAEAWHVNLILVFNKVDLYEEEEWEELARLTEIYENVGYKVIPISVEKNTGLDTIKDILKDKRTLVSGQSGVGKSSLVNTIFPEVDIRTQEVSEWNGKGQHTTTHAEMFDLPNGGQLIDTPGIKEFGLINDIKTYELSHYFPEMRQRLGQCRFNNCLHVNEPNCAIKAAVESEEISMERYINYRMILESMDDRHYI